MPDDRSSEMEKKSQFQKNWEKLANIANIERALNALSYNNTAQPGSPLDVAYEMVFKDLFTKLLQLNDKDLDNEENK